MGIQIPEELEWEEQVGFKICITALSSVCKEHVG